MKAYLQTALLWISGGSLGGIPVGVALATVSGLSQVGLFYWLGFGMLLGCVAGFGAFFLLSLMYQARPDMDNPFLVEIIPIQHP